MLRRARPIAGALAAIVVGGSLLGACGGGTSTVTVSGTPTAAGGGQTTAHTRSSAAAPTRTSTTPKSSASTTVPQSESQHSASTTHTASAPAFVHAGGQSSEQATGSQAAAAAQVVVTTHGYTPADVSTYHPNQTLRVLIGTRTGSADGHDQRAFFFLDNRYLGTDSSQPSASVRVVSQSDTEVTLAYALYRSHDPLCCPSGGDATVRFQLDNGQLVPLDPIPPASSATGLARQ